jgi:hypothetical protein
MLVTTFFVWSAATNGFIVWERIFLTESKSLFNFLDIDSLALAAGTWYDFLLLKYSVVFGAKVHFESSNSAFFFSKSCSLWVLGLQEASREMTSGLTLEVFGLGG